jgi:tripartite-type tricarboxylate transporter receptor subunit TctC
MKWITRRRLLMAAAAAPFVTTRARAANYPDRPIRVIIPYTAGGVAENLMRLLAVSMEQRLGQKLVLEAKPGAAGNIGTQEVARAAPDGYTLLVAATNNFAINQFVIRMPFDPVTALAPIAKAAEVPLVLFSNPEVPARTLREFMDYARANPSKANYGIPSLGTVNHLMMERLKQTSGVEITRVPFRPMLPAVPTMAESGFQGFVASNWWGIAAPAGTPDNVLDTLALAVAEAQKTDTVKERFAVLGMLSPEQTRPQFAASIKAEADLWREIVQRGKIILE